MYKGSFAQCLTRGAEMMRRHEVELVLLWQKEPEAEWCVASYKVRYMAGEVIADEMPWRYIGLDYEGMRSLLQWVGANIIKGSN